MLFGIGWCLDVNFMDGDYVVVYVNSVGIYIILDGGTIWIFVEFLLVEVWDIVFVLGMFNIVVVGIFVGVYVFIDGGVQWFVFNVGLINIYL